MPAKPMIPKQSGPFDPAAGTVVASPLGNGAGWWAGAPGVTYDRELAKFYLVYRLRKPRDLGRGVEAVLAESNDGLRFQPVWSLHQRSLDSPSIERCALVKAGGNRFLFYVSYVDPRDLRWRIDVMEASRIDGFDPAQRRSVFVAPEIGLEGVKDPWLLRENDRWWMFVSAAAPWSDVSEQQRKTMHETADAFNTGSVRSFSGLASSTDGIHFDWHGEVLGGRQGAWDANTARITAVIPVAGLYLAFYDGCPSVRENYEEKTGLAFSTDMQRFVSVTPDGPLLVSHHGSGSLRYLHVVRVRDAWFYYYESARQDGAHELRVNRVPAGGGL